MLQQATRDIGEVLETAPSGNDTVLRIRMNKPQNPAQPYAVVMGTNRLHGKDGLVGFMGGQYNLTEERSLALFQRMQR